MKYLLVISSLIVAGLTVAVAQVVDGENTRGVKTLDGIATPSLSHIATPGFIMAKQVKLSKRHPTQQGITYGPTEDSDVGGRRPTPSSSYVASPVFTTDS